MVNGEIRGGVMIHLTLIMLIGIHPLLRWPIVTFIQPENPLLTIDFSLDSKADSEFGHTVIRYLLSEAGQEIDMRYVHDWAMQMTHHKDLPKSTVDRIVEMVRGLPDPEEENIPKEWLVTIKLRDGNEVRVREYHRKRLPRALRESLELLGGIRSELRDTIEFVP